MKKLVLLIVLSSTATVLVSAQTKTRPLTTPTPAATPAATSPRSAVDKGKVVGRTYTNMFFGFQLVFPDTWLIPGDDFDAYMKKQGIDLSLKAPSSLTPAGQAKINEAVKNVTILMTGYRSLPGTLDNAILRVSVEDLTPNPQIKDAVDYFDAMRATFKSVKLPADFTYSETQAEKLGSMQFGYLDTATKGGKKRMYATVRKGYAIMFTLTYSADDDLATMRQVLEEGNFDLK